MSPLNVPKIQGPNVEYSDRFIPINQTQPQEFDLTPPTANNASAGVFDYGINDVAVVGQATQMAAVSASSYIDSLFEQIIDRLGSIESVVFKGQSDFRLDSSPTNVDIPRVFAPSDSIKINQASVDLNNPIQYESAIVSQNQDVSSVFDPLTRTQDYFDRTQAPSQELKEVPFSQFEAEKETIQSVQNNSVEVSISNKADSVINNSIEQIVNPAPVEVQREVVDNFLQSTPEYYPESFSDNNEQTTVTSSQIEYIAPQNQAVMGIREEPLGYFGNNQVTTVPEVVIERQIGTEEVKVESGVILESQQPNVVTEKSFEFIQDGAINNAPEPYTQEILVEKSTSTEQQVAAVYIEPVSALQPDQNFASVEIKSEEVAGFKQESPLFMGELQQMQTTINMIPEIVTETGPAGGSVRSVGHYRMGLEDLDVASRTDSIHDTEWRRELPEAGGVWSGKVFYEGSLIEDYSASQAWPDNISGEYIKVAIDGSSVSFTNSASQSAGYPEYFYYKVAKLTPDGYVPSNDHAGGVHVWVELPEAVDGESDWHNPETLFVLARAIDSGSQPTETYNNEWVEIAPIPPAPDLNYELLSLSSEYGDHEWGDTIPLASGDMDRGNVSDSLARKVLTKLPSSSGSREDKYETEFHPFFSVPKPSGYEGPLVQTDGLYFWEGGWDGTIEVVTDVEVTDNAIKFKRKEITYRYGIIRQEDPPIDLDDIEIAVQDCT